MALADAAVGVNNAVQQILLRKIQEQRYADALKQQAFENQRQLGADTRAQQQLDETSALRKAAETERQSEHDALQGDKLNESIPGDTRLEPTDRAVGFLRSAGVPLQAVPGVPAMGPEFQGPMQNGVTPQQAQVGIGAGYLKTASAKQQQAASEEVRKRQADADRAETANWRTGIQQDLANLRQSQGPPAQSHQLVPEVDPKTGQQTGRFLGYNTKTNAFEPVGGVAPQATKAPPGAAQDAEKEKSKTTARTTLDRLDQDIDTAASKGLIGPMAGRVSDFEQMVGNNDPAISTLATRMVAAKMLVDAGIGGMRGAASPGLMARWDKLMGMQATPENLHAVAQVMREMVGGGDVKGAGGGKIRARDPQGVLHEAPAGTALPAGWKLER